MKFTLNEKFILDERFILDEATLPEYRKKEAELRKAVENKKAELNEVLKNLESVILGDAKDGDGRAAAQKRLDKYEKPCGELVAKIDAFLQDFANKNIEISSKEDAEEVDDFIELAEENVFPGGSAKAAEDAPDIDDNIIKAAENVNKLINKLQKLATGLSVIGRKAGENDIDVPSSVFSSDWTAFMKNAADKKAAWEAYYRAWDSHKGGPGTNDGVVYKRIAGLGTAFIQGLDRLGYTKANPFIVYLDRIIKDCPITWKTYAMLHNAYIDHKTTVKDWLEGKGNANLPTDKNIINNPHWHEIADANLAQQYLSAQYNLWKNSAQSAEKTETIDGLAIVEGEELGAKIVDILYKNGDNLRDIDIIGQIANLFNANMKKRKEMSDADAESILSLYPGMAANDANAQDLAKMIIYTTTPSANHSKIMAEHDLTGGILSFNNPEVVAENYNKLRNIDNLGARLSTILNALVPAKEKAN